MKKKGLYQKPELTTVSFLASVDVITASNDSEGGVGTVVPPISNGGDYKGDNY